MSQFDSTRSQYFLKPKILFEKYFSLLSNFLFNQAIDTLKKSTNSLGSPWNNFISPLQLLASSENLYYSLTYLEYRWIRKDHLDNMYMQTLSDLNKVVREFKTAAANPSFLTQEKEELQNFQALIFQTGILASLRTELINIYRTLAAFRGPPDYGAYVKSLSTIKEQIMLGCNHTFLTSVKYNMETEVSVLLNLLKTQIHLGNYDYKESIFLLYAAKIELDAWRQKFSENTISKDSDSQKLIKMGVFHWLFLFQRSLHSKLTFYFYFIHENYEKSFSGDMNLMDPQLDINYYSVVQNFVIKSSCHSVYLVMDASPINNKIPTGEPNVGYQCHLVEPEHPQGLRSWPCVFHFPREVTPKQYWPNIVSLIMDNGDLLDTFKEPFYYHDSRMNFTYYISKIETRLLIVVLFNKKRKKSDQVTQEFLYILTTHLRNWKLFSRLKPISS